MTRINLGVGAHELCDQHLLAEYRELPRIRGLLFQTIERGSPLRSRIPSTFSLGKGHMLFFLNKGAFLQKRWEGLVRELRLRGVSLSFMTWRDYPSVYDDIFLLHDIGPEEQARGRTILLPRLVGRLLTARKPPTWKLREPPSWWISKASLNV